MGEYLNICYVNSGLNGHFNITGKEKSNGYFPKGACTKDGKYSIPVSRGYEYVRYVTEDDGSYPYFEVKRNGLEGACDISGKEIIAPIYENLLFYNEARGGFTTKKDGEYILVKHWGNNNSESTMNTSQSHSLASYEEREVEQLIELVNNQNYKSAIKRANAILKYSSNTSIYYIRGYSQYQRGKWKDAIKDFEVVLQKGDCPEEFLNNASSLLASAKENRQHQLEQRALIWTAVATGVAQGAANFQNAQMRTTPTTTYIPTASAYVTNNEGSSSGNSSPKIREKSCKFCSGSGKCNGRNRCRGTGKCNFCNGEKWQITTGLYHKCGPCNGTGNCNFCRGTGKCNHCNGTGKS